MLCRQVLSGARRNRVRDAAVCNEPVAGGWSRVDRWARDRFARGRDRVQREGQVADPASSEAAAAADDDEGCALAVEAARDELAAESRRCTFRVNFPLCSNEPSPLCLPSYRGARNDPGRPRASRRSNEEPLGGVAKQRVFESLAAEASQLGEGGRCMIKPMTWESA